MADRKVNPPIAKSEDLLQTPPGRGLYPALFKPDELQNQYKLVLVVDAAHPVFKEFSAKVKAFGNDAFAKIGKPDGLTWPIRKGEDFATPEKKMSDEARALCQGKMVILAKSKFAPQLSVLRDKKFERLNPDDPGVQSMFYSGMVCAMAGTLEAYNGRYPSVTLRLNEVAKVANAEKVGGRDPNTVFSGLADHEDASIGKDSGGDLDDEIPF